MIYCEIPGNCSSVWASKSKLRRLQCLLHAHKRLTTRRVVRTCLIFDTAKLCMRVRWLMHSRASFDEKMSERKLDAPEQFVEPGGWCGGFIGISGRIQFYTYWLTAFPFFPVPSAVLFVWEFATLMVIQRRLKWTQMGFTYLSSLAQSAPVRNHNDCEWSVHCPLC